jgi:hypothetical protein
MTAINPQLVTTAFDWEDAVTRLETVFAAEVATRR